MLADLVLHCAYGFVEVVDDKVGGPGAYDSAEVRGVAVDCQRDSPGYVCGYGKGCTGWIEAEGEDELSAPALVKVMKGGEGAEDLFLGLAGIGNGGHSKEIVSQQMAERERAADTRFQYF